MGFKPRCWLIVLLPFEAACWSHLSSSKSQMKKSSLDFHLLDNETSMLSGNVGELSVTSDKYGRGLQNPLPLRM